MNNLSEYCIGQGLPAKQDYWRKQHIPALKRAGLISEEKDINDKRNKIFVPQLDTVNASNLSVQNIDPRPISLTEEEKYYVEHADELDPGKDN